MDSIANRLKQRSNFQFSLIRLNLVACGAIVAFALEPTTKYEHALLLAPIISFALFSLWVHHAIVIHHNRPEILKPAEGFWQILRIATFSFSILINFVLLPTGSILLYSSSEYSWIETVDYVLLALIVVFYVSWVYLCYFRKGRLAQGSAEEE
jgi:hypothetical protein